MTNLALGDAVINQVDGKRVIEIHSHPAHERQCGIRDDPARRRRQQQTDMLLVGRQHFAGENSAEHQSPQKQLAAGELGAHRVDDLHLPALAPTHPQELLRQISNGGRWNCIGHS